MREKESLCERPLAFRVAFADMEHLEEICERLNLDKSEILRRAVREGLKTFTGVQLPGVE